MIPFEAIRGQDQAAGFLRAALSSGRLAHAYLLAGPPGTGKLSMALDLAAAWMCRSDPSGFCGECPQCTRIFGFDHPDVRMTIPRMAATTPEQEMELLAARKLDGTTPLRFEGNTSIRIDQVREIERRMALKPFEGRGRVEIVVDADRMMAEGANALLKTLEEPPGETLILLLTSVYIRIIPTIRSRAHLVRLCRVPADVIAGILVDRRGADPDSARDIASMADGSVGRALSLHDGGTSAGDRVTSGVLSALAGCSSPSEVSVLASEMAKELGREGLLTLCGELRMIAHDVRRSEFDRPPLTVDPGVGVLRGLDDLALDHVGSLLRECETRLGGNVMPSMALHAALSGCWVELRRRGAVG